MRFFHRCDRPRRRRRTRRSSRVVERAYRAGRDDRRCVRQRAARPPPAARHRRSRRVASACDTDGLRPAARGGDASGTGERRPAPARRRRYAPPVTRRRSRKSPAFHSSSRARRDQAPLADSGGSRRSPATAAFLSATVLLRPVLERAMLPTAAYVGGPGEIAYFAQVTCRGGRARRADSHWSCHAGPRRSSTRERSAPSTISAPRSRSFPIRTPSSRVRHASVYRWRRSGAQHATRRHARRRRPSTR